MNRNSFNAFFFVKRTKLLSNGEAPIRPRIRVNGITVESQITRAPRTVTRLNKKPLVFLPTGSATVCRTKQPQSARSTPMPRLRCNQQHADLPRWYTVPTSCIVSQDAPPRHTTNRAGEPASVHAKRHCPATGSNPTAARKTKGWSLPPPAERTTDRAPLRRPPRQ